MCVQPPDGKERSLVHSLPAAELCNRRIRLAYQGEQRDPHCGAGSDLEDIQRQFAKSGAHSRQEHASCQVADHDDHTADNCGKDEAQQSMPSLAGPADNPAL